MPRDLPAVQAPIIGASGIQQRRRSNQETPRYQIGTKGKLPSPSRHQENPACGRRCGARTASASRASPLPTTLTLPAGLPSIPSSPSSLHSCCLAPRRRRVVKAQHKQAFKAGASQQRLLPHPQARAFFAQLLTNIAGAPAAAIPQHPRPCRSLAPKRSSSLSLAAAPRRPPQVSAPSALVPPQSRAVRTDTAHRHVKLYAEHLACLATPIVPLPTLRTLCTAARQGAPVRKLFALPPPPSSLPSRAHAVVFFDRNSSIS